MDGRAIGRMSGCCPSRERGVWTVELEGREARRHDIHADNAEWEGIGGRKEET